VPLGRRLLCAALHEEAKQERHHEQQHYPEITSDFFTCIHCFTIKNANNARKKRDQKAPARKSTIVIVGS